MTKTIAQTERELNQQAESLNEWLDSNDNTTETWKAVARALQSVNQARQHLFTAHALA